MVQCVNQRVYPSVELWEPVKPLKLINRLIIRWSYESRSNHVGWSATLLHGVFVFHVHRSKPKLHDHISTANIHHHSYIPAAPRQFRLLATQNILLGILSPSRIIQCRLFDGIVKWTSDRFNYYNNGRCFHTFMRWYLTYSVALHYPRSFRSLKTLNFRIESVFWLLKTTELFNYQDWRRSQNDTNRLLIYPRESKNDAFVGSDAGGAFINNRTRWHGLMDIPVRLYQ